jgi:hypothetical protein
METTEPILTAHPAGDDSTVNLLFILGGLDLASLRIQDADKDLLPSRDAEREAVEIVGYLPGPWIMHRKGRIDNHSSETILKQRESVPGRG